MADPVYNPQFLPRAYGPVPPRPEVLQQAQLPQFFQPAPMPGRGGDPRTFAPVQPQPEVTGTVAKEQPVPLTLPPVGYGRPRNPFDGLQAAAPVFAAAAKASTPAVAVPRFDESSFGSSGKRYTVNDSPAAPAGPAPGQYTVGQMAALAKLIPLPKPLNVLQQQQAAILSQGMDWYQNAQAKATTSKERLDALQGLAGFYGGVQRGNAMTNGIGLPMLPGWGDEY